MKILFFSDIHGNQYVLRILVKELPAINPDLIVFGGDVFGYYYGQQEIIDTLREIECVCLMGNHDKYFLDLCSGQTDEEYLVSRYGSTYSKSLLSVSEENISFIRRLKSRYDIELNGLHLSFVHGSITDYLEGRIYPDAVIEDTRPYMGLDYVFCGHTHHKMCMKLNNGTILINPGSIGQQRDGTGCKYIVFDSKDESYYFGEIQYDRKALEKEIKENNEKEDMECKLIEVLYRDYR